MGRVDRGRVPKPVRNFVRLAPEGKEEAWTSVVQSLLALAGLTQTKRRIQSYESCEDASNQKRGAAKSFHSEKERWVPNRLSVKGNESLSEYSALLKVGNRNRKR